MAEGVASTIASSTRRYILRGLLTVIPIWVTWLVFKFLFGLLIGTAGPFVAWLAGIVMPHSPALAVWLSESKIQAVLAVVMVLVSLYILGWIATKVVGRRILSFFDSLVNKIPIVKTIYGSVKKFLSAMEQKPDGVQRVVLIDFPSPEMRAVGLVTRTLIDEDTGRELAAVYVPTTPNPTSGYLEIVPVDRVVSTNWTMDEAMTFIVSGGAVAPDKMNYAKSAKD